jgi:three-Cys-motif partner protein
VPNPEKYTYDKIGIWSEIKLEIIRKYAQAYSKIMAGKGFKYIYIDAFSGGGRHKSKKDGRLIDGSPVNALAVEPPFFEYHFIDIDRKKINALSKAVEGKDNVHLYNEDCNTVLLEKVFPRARWTDYRRALCILDPYGLHLDWEVIRTAGELKTIDIFLNFPIMDINMNVLRHDTGKVEKDQAARFTRFWGDESWREISYKSSPQLPLWGDCDTIKQGNDIVAEAFRQRLISVAGFTNVPRPIPMKNQKKATVYYLYFASQKPVAMHIVKDIFKRYT